MTGLTSCLDGPVLSIERKIGGSAFFPGRGVSHVLMTGTCLSTMLRMKVIFERSSVLPR